MPVILFSRKRDLIEDREYFFLNQKVKGARNIMKPIYRSVKIFLTRVDEYVIYR